jgi:EAL domain-containing protein (putative c-di-GMP-specific phosphodiesterase class I)
MSAADQACSLAKANGGNRVQLFRPDDRQIRRRRAELRWVERLITALYSDGFTLHAQEIRSLERRTWGGAVRGMNGVRRFELLLRLAEGDGLTVEPMAFIPAAERYGLMPRIDRWVIARACRELAALRAAGQMLPLCTINLSGYTR